MLTGSVNKAASSNSELTYLRETNNRFGAIDSTGTVKNKNPAENQPQRSAVSFNMPIRQLVENPGALHWGSGLGLTRSELAAQIASLYVPVGRQARNISSQNIYTGGQSGVEFSASKLESAKVPSYEHAVALKARQEMLKDQPPAKRQKPMHTAAVCEPIRMYNFDIDEKYQEIYNKVTILMNNMKNFSAALLDNPTIGSCEKSFIHHMSGAKSAAEFLAIMNKLSFQESMERKPFSIFEDLPNIADFSKKLRRADEIFSSDIVRSLILAKFEELIIKNNLSTEKELKECIELNFPTTHAKNIYMKESIGKPQSHKEKTVIDFEESAISTIDFAHPSAGLSNADFDPTGISIDHIDIGGFLDALLASQNAVSKQS